MDKTERETHDFMNVETFSQLPFIRPAPPPKGSGAGGAIRLFGQEFKAKTTAAAAASDEENSSTKQEQADPTNKDNNIEDQTMTSSSSSNRKFECHYCCRNFPTSQALGGHQNAHKRERQHAKRAHLQSAMGLSDAHVYAGLMNYSATSRLGSAQLPIAYNHHSSWNNSTNSTTPYLSGAGSTRLYGASHGASFGAGHHHHQTAAPINGNPLAMWRVPTAHGSSVFSSHHDHQRPLHHSQISSSFNNKNVISRGGTNIGSQSRFGYHETKGSMQDHVSLDLHL